ncbi:hypothetical protein JW916_10145 [Candidatus Sumerlaeota bacterium]|nr:hypothetical protein [Candidatus Sumerlaeota bacterium]
MTDDSPSPTARKRTRRRVGRRTRRLAVFAVLFFALLAAGVWWLSKRGGPDYFGQPESLLPSNTAVMASCRDLSGLLKEIESLGAVERLRRDEDLAALLLSSAAWRRLQREKDKAYYGLMERMARDFVDTWFGREVTLAVLPPSASPGEPRPARSGLVVIARTDIGFEESLAELVAHYYPELSIEKREYRNRALYRYNAEKSRRAFAYCRFGRTVVVSLRSAEWRWLEEVVDRRLGTDSRGRPLPALTGESWFQGAIEWSRTERGLSVCIDPRTLAEAMRSFPGKSFQRPTWRFWIDYGEERLRSTEWGAVRVSLDRGLRLVSVWKNREEDVAPAARGDSKSEGPTASKASEAMRRLQALPEDCPLALWLESPRLAAFANDLIRRMRDSQTYDDKVASAEEDWREWTGSSLTTDWIEPMGDTLGAGLTGLVGGSVLPVPIAQGWFETSRPADATKLAQTLESNAVATKPPVLVLPVGRIEFRADESTLLLDLNPGIAPHPREEIEGNEDRGLSGHPLLSDVWQPNGEGPTLCVFANFESGYRCLEQVRAAAMIWSKSARENLESWETILAAARHLRSFRLVATPSSEGIRVEAVVSVD